MPKMCEIVAVVKDRKGAGEAVLTQAYQRAQKAGGFEGLVRNYTPRDEDGLQLPREGKNIEMTVEALLGAMRPEIVDMLDTTLLQDLGNTEARASISVGDSFLLEDVPATHLLYLEKFAEKLVTFVQSLPTLDNGTTWQPDAQYSGIYRSEPVQKFRTAKVERPLVLAEATDKHPAQVKVITRDVVEGTWEETRVSGAIPYDQKSGMLRRAIQFRDAVRVARERANATDISHLTDRKEGDTILRFVFGR